MSKQDGVYTRTAAALEQKHYFNKKFSEILGVVSDTRNKIVSVESTIATIIKTTDKDRAAIKLLVEYDSEGNPTASGSFIIQAINGESSGKIKADRLDIDGKELDIKVKATNITGTFTVKESDGDTLFSAGNGAVKIGDWNVDNNSLWTGTSFSASNSVFLSTGSNGNLSIAGSPAQENWVFKTGPRFGVNKNGDLWCSSFNLGSVSTDELGAYRETSISNDAFVYERGHSYFRLSEVSAAPIDLCLEALIDPAGVGTTDNSNYTLLKMTSENGFAKGVLAGEWYVRLSDGREINLAEYLENHGG